jgi:hypothetical protein
MRSDTFDGLSRWISPSASRRSVLGALLGTTLLTSALGTAAAKSKRNRKARRRSNTRRQDNRDAGARMTNEVSAQANEENHCIAPNGADLNEIYGVSAQIVTSFCNQVASGEQWVAPGAPWSVNDTFKLVPKSFVPEGDTPLEDFIAKFQAVKYVIDPGTKQEKTVVFPNDGTLFTSGGSVFPGTPADWSVVSPITLGTLNPLSIGGHQAQVYWVFRAMHCDGVANKIDANCLGPGEVLYTSPSFTVTA